VSPGSLLSASCSLRDPAAPLRRQFESLALPSSPTFSSSFCPSPERKRGRGARFGRGGGHYPSDLRIQRENRFQHQLRINRCNSLTRDFHLVHHVSSLSSVPAPATVTPHTNVSILDTGANISVVTPQTVTDLGLLPIALPSPISIQMADSSIVEVNSLVSLGPILGTAAVINLATNNLVSPCHMISNGYELHFTQSGAGIFRQNQLIHKGTLDPVSKLFIIDLLDLVPRVPDILTSSLPQVNSTTKPVLSPRKVLEILWLH